MSSPLNEAFGTEQTDIPHGGLPPSQDEGASRSLISVLRNLTHSVGEVAEGSAELGARLVRDEFDRFRSNLQRWIPAGVFLTLGIGLTTGGLVLGLAAFVGTTVACLIIGVVYLAAGALLLRGRVDDGATAGGAER